MAASPVRGVAGALMGQGDDLPRIGPERGVDWNMGLILLEALLALVLLLAIVWWTMFAGRKRGELPDAVGDAAAEVGTDPSRAPAPDAAQAAAPAAPARSGPRE